MGVDAGHPHHQHRGHDQQGVIHGQPQQQRVHRAGHCWPGNGFLRAVDNYEADMCLSYLSSALFIACKSLLTRILKT